MKIIVTGSLGNISKPLTFIKVSAMPPKKSPNFKPVNGALRYTFALTDVWDASMV